MTDSWTKEWPTEPGQYWLYGQAFRSWGGEKKPRLFLVKVRGISNGVAYVVDGHFIYKAEGAQGWWQPAILPELPEDV